MVAEMTKAQLAREWHEWLLTLNPWERHYVFATIPDGIGTKSRELDWFEDFVAGTVTLDILSELLAKAFDVHSVKA